MLLRPSSPPPLNIHLGSVNSNFLLQFLRLSEKKKKSEAAKLSAALMSEM